MRPGHNNVIIRPVTIKEYGSIAIPDIAIDEPEGISSHTYVRPWARLAIGTVVALGKGKRFVDEDGDATWQPIDDLRVGDMVAYERGSAQAVEWPGEEKTCVLHHYDGVYFVVEGGRACLEGLETA